VPEANYGVVGVLLAERATDVAMTESSARAARLCERNVARNDVRARVGVALATGVAALDERVVPVPDERPDSALDGGRWDCGTPHDCEILHDRVFDAVAYAPEPYTPLSVGIQRVADAAPRLADDGRVYVAAAKSSGLARYEDALASLAGDVERLGSRDGVRVLGATVPADGENASLPERVSIREFDAVVDGAALSLASVPGVFSASQVDDGTRLLAETARVADGDRVLDLCCGYGALGTYAASVADCDVWVTDDDRVATACAERTLAATGVDGSVVTADGVAGVAHLTFDRVFCNPPTHATDRTLREVFDGVRDVLAEDGEFWVVHHRDLDLRPLLAGFDRVEQDAVEGEYVVLRVT
jgi:16S rRNA (guanine1207-N2)-methyltransferase